MAPAPVQTAGCAVRKFNLVFDPWIPALDASGKQRLVGIREVLLEAHRIRRISPVSPLAEVAIHRLLVAVLHRALRGPSDSVEAADIYRAGRFPGEPIETYLNRWVDRFDLFHQDYPFYQVPDLPLDNPLPWTKLLPELSSGENPTLFDHTMDDQPPPISPAEAAIALIVHQSFVPGGLINRLGVASGKAGHPGAAAVFLPQGASLFETLLLNLVPYGKAAGDDRPIWERDPYRKSDVEGGKARETLTGLTRIYTWMSRAVRLLLDEDGMVRRIGYGPGVTPDPGPDLDPMCAYRLTGNAPTPYRLPEDRSFWRDFEALLPGEDGWRAPRVLEHARDFLRDTERTSLLFPLVVVGQLTKQYKVLDIRREVYPLSVRALDPEPAGRIRDALELARGVGKALHTAGRTIADFLLSPGVAKREADRFVDSLPLHAMYWSTLETRFPGFLEGLTTKGPEEALEEWRSAVRKAAQDAWNTTAQTVGTTPRNLEAIARAETRLAAELNRRLAA